MAFLKKLKDQLVKRTIYGKESVPRGLLELNSYFRLYGPISFNYVKKDGQTIAISGNFNQGSIITSGRDEKELDQNIKDAILTAFSVPSSYASEAKIARMESQEGVYALA